MNEKFALVTGASTGIGLEISWLLAKKGYSLLLVSNQEEQLRQLRKSIIDKCSIRVEILFIDLALMESPDTLYQYCLSERIEVEVLVNNAGFYFFGEVTGADVVKAQQMIHLHVVTTSTLCTLFGNQMKIKKSGYILNVSSISAFKDFPGIAYYGSTKSYIKSFTRSLRTELKYHGIHVTCLCPGPTATSLYHAPEINSVLLSRLGIVLSPQTVARQGISGLFSDKALVIPGFVTKIILILTILTPQWVIYEIRKHSKWLK